MKIEPLYNKARTPWQKTLVVVAGVLVFFLVGALVDRAFTMPTVGERWRPSQSYDMPKIDMTIWQRNQYGDIYPKVVSGHRVCPKGHYLVQSKYTGVSCESEATDRQVAKVVIKCGAQVLAGWYFGDKKGLYAAAVGCGIDWSIR